MFGVIYSQRVTCEVIPNDSLDKHEWMALVEHKISGKMPLQKEICTGQNGAKENKNLHRTAEKHSKA